MIAHFSDHAANERTFLAWVRTAIAVMAFGFLVEKFDLFLEIMAARAPGTRMPSPLGQMVGNVAGLLLILLGGTMMATAAVRYRSVGRAIDAQQPMTLRGTRAELAMVGLLLALGATLFAYLLFTVLRQL